MIKLVSAYLAFGARPILDEVSWMLGEQDRVGLVGENGSGKTTLLKVMAGKAELDRGAIEVSSGLDVGYLPQEGVTHAGRTLEQEARSALEPVLAMEREYKRIQEDLRTGGQDEHEQQALAERMCELMDRFEMSGGYEVDARVAKTLTGLGFSEEEFENPVESFSGGWQMRVALAKILLAAPKAILLDEPTNYLDLEARTWLEEYLANYPYSYMIVSHDRYFLDVTVNRIVEIERGALVDYRGNYSYYLREKEKRTLLARAAYEKQQDEIARTKTFINKYKADKKRAGQVQSRAKRLEKIELLEPPAVTDTVHFQFPAPPRGPLELVRMEDVRKSYGDHEVLHGVNLVLTRGEKVAVVGPNGAGKTTLLKILSGRMEPSPGVRNFGQGTEIAYFGQGAGEDLPGDDTVLDAIGRGAPFDMVPRLRNLLGAFLFGGEDVDKKVKVLSGGEKSRLALARLLLRPANLLILDEPTNHLDLRAKEVLMNAFQSFQGTLVFVAHDRYFLEKLPDKVLDIRDGLAYSYHGDYTDFLLAREREEAQARGEAEEGKKSAAKKTPAAPKHEEPPRAETAGPDPKAAAKERRIQEREKKKAAQRKVAKLDKKIAELEEKIQKAETYLEGLSGKMSSPEVGSNYTKLMELTGEHQMKSRMLDELYRQWEELSKQRDQVE